MSQLISHSCHHIENERLTVKKSGGNQKKIANSFKTAAVTFALKKLRNSIFAKHNKIKIQAPEIAPYLLLPEKQTKHNSKDLTINFPPPSPPFIYILVSQTFTSIWSIGWKPIQISLSTHQDIHFLCTVQWIKSVLIKIIFNG